MKKAIIALLLACFVGAIAFASLRNRSTINQTPDKKQEVKKQKKECRHSCIFG
jgi:hypothetical protein